MNAYSIALFLHIVGALGFFAALGMEWVTVIQLRRATTAEQVQEWLGASASLRRVGMLSGLLLLVAGLYMMSTWGGVAWLLVTFAAIVLLMIVMMRVSAPRMKAIGKASTVENGLLSTTTQNLLRDSMLRIGIQARVIMALGIVFLMTVKPDLVGSLLTVGISIVLSLVWGLLIVNRDRKPADRTLGGAV